MSCRLRSLVSRGLHQATRHSATARRSNGRVVASHHMAAAARVVFDPFDNRSNPHVSQLLIFDFDGTLVLTPEPETGRVHYEQLTGKPWPHGGWWGRAESLRPPLPMAPGPALPAFRTACHLSGAHLVMMTGRREFLRREVKTVLEQFNVAADFEILNDTHLETFAYKAERIRRMCAAYPTLREIVIYEDRPEHSTRFCELSREFPSLAWRVITVHPANPPLVEAFNGAPAHDALVAAERALAAAETAEDSRIALPRFSGSGGYERYCIVMPPEAAAVPEAWVAAKEERDGPNEAHVTLLNRLEVKDLLLRLERKGFRPADAKARLRAAVRHIPITLQLGDVGMVGRGGNLSVFITCSWPEANAFRSALGRAGLRLSQSKSRWLPRVDFHVTLGFLGKDVHGVPKDNSTLIQGNPAGADAPWRTADTADLAVAIARRASELLAASPARDSPGSYSAWGGGTPSPMRSGGGSPSGRARASPQGGRGSPRGPLAVVSGVPEQGEQQQQLVATGGGGQQQARSGRGEEDVAVASAGSPATPEAAAAAAAPSGGEEEEDKGAVLAALSSRVESLKIRAP